MKNRTERGAEMSGKVKFREGDALMIIDPQKDFFPGGGLPVESGDIVLPVINAWIREAVDAGIPVIATRDWHPAGHPSFDTEGGQWPVHCVQDSDGAMFHDDLLLPADAVVCSKGTRFDRDQYSGFDETGLEVFLQKLGVRRIFMCGLALDVCVKATAMDTRKLGFEAVLIMEGTRPVTGRGGERAIAEMKAAGVEITDADPGGIVPAGPEPSAADI